MEIVNDSTCSWINDLTPRTNIKSLQSNEDCEWLIKNYGIGAQIIKSLNIKNMILVTRSKKKVVGLDGYGIKITKQEIIK